MANTSEEPVADGRRFKASTTRITLLAIAASGVYGIGILIVMWAAHLSVNAAHASLPIPVWPWVLAFIFVVGGMLSVIYGFFFRPRELRLSRDQVALVYWDGNGKKISRDQVRQVVDRPGGLLLRGPEKSLSIGRIFNEWESIRAELAGWEKK